MRLTTVLLARGPAAAIVLTDEQVASLSAKKAFPVRVTIGQRTARLRLARMGGENLIGLSKATRAELGVEGGDQVEIEIVVDDEPREVAVPDDLAAALAAEGVADAFAALAPSRRKELVRGVEEAKKPETRERRIAAAVAAARG